MADVTVKREAKLFAPDVLTTSVTVKAPSSGGRSTALKAGQLVFLASDASGYEALATAGATAVGVLAEDITPTTSGVTAKVAYAGHVYLDGVREAGDKTTYASDLKLMNCVGHIIFVKEEAR
jgi:hypothetical protein